MLTLPAKSAYNTYMQNDDKPNTILVHKGDEEPCEFSAHPGDMMDMTCVHGFRLIEIWND